MAEMEEEVVEPIDNEEVDVDAPADTETDNDSDITFEQALEWKKQAKSAEAEKLRREKAEKALVELKKASKKESFDTLSPKEEIRRILSEEKFYDKNPEALSYRGKIEKYQSQGLSLEDSYYLAAKSDKEVEANREVYGKSIVRGQAQATEGIKLVSLSDYDAMTPTEQTKYNSDSKGRYGVVKFK